MQGTKYRSVYLMHGIMESHKKGSVSLPLELGMTLQIPYILIFRHRININRYFVTYFLIVLRAKELFIPKIKGKYLNLFLPAVTGGIFRKILLKNI